MRKKVLVLLCLIAIPIYGKQNPVKINLNAPAQVVAGSSIEVTLIINKGDLKDYSRFSQDLPAGFTAENIESPNADFTFTDQRIRIIWLKLPSDKEITVKYLINVHERLSGVLDLAGTFAYVDRGERAFIELKDPTQVEILPNPDIDPSLVVDISEFNSIKTPVNIVYPDEEPKVENFAVVVRQKPFIENSGNVYVTLLVTNPESSDFLKLEESIPGGYAFEAVSANGAVVSQSSGLARFVWMNAPSATTFTVSYRLVPIIGRSQDPLKIDGNLTYGENGSSKTETVREMDVAIDAMSASQQQAFIKTGVVPQGLKVSPKEKAPPVRVSEVKEKEKAVAQVSKKNTGRNYGLTLPVIETLEASKGVQYRVQIAAVRHPYFDRVVFAQYDLFRDVKVERIDGWSKYTVGSMTELESAVQLKNRIISETPEDSAFVVAYIDGKRVPLLMAYNYQNQSPQYNLARENTNKSLNNSQKELIEKSSDLSLLELDALEISDGVFFRVQVAALRNPSYDRKYFLKYDVLKGAKIENIEGWKKFTVGSVSNYEEAVQLKNKVNSEIPKSSAFIVAYKNEKRVPIQEVVVR